MRTDANLNAICEALTANCGDLYDACLRVGLSLTFVAQWKADDAEAGAAMQEAERLGAMRIQSAMIRRGVDGIMQPVFYQGEVVGHKAEFSDGLLLALAKGRLPQIFAADSGGGQVFNGPVQINNMPRANTYEDWLLMKTATLEARDDTRQLPAPLKVLDPPIDVTPAAVAAYELMRPPNAFEGVDL